MDNFKKIFLFFSLLIAFSACEEFLEPGGEIIVEEDKLFKEWSDFRAAEMGLYAIQQELVEQLIVLGELRGDLLEVTENADVDLREVYNFNISKDNKYASPVNFYKLIINSNKLIQKIVQTKPAVLVKGGEIDNYDRLYGEVQCMLAWTYFNAVRIYGEVPYIYPHLNNIAEIEKYVNEGFTILDSMDVFYDLRGYQNDTVRNTLKTYPKKFLDLRAVVDTFTNILENQVKIVGVVHNADNNDASWDVTVWNKYSFHCLLGQMYLYYGNLEKAEGNFKPILYNYERFLLDLSFRNLQWGNIFSGINGSEHIYTIWFDKGYKQQNTLQYLFSNQGSNSYKLRPAKLAFGYWENIFDGMSLNEDPIYPEKTLLSNPGLPGDFYRGHGVTYQYYKNGVPMTNSEVLIALQYRMNEKNVDADRIMEAAIPVVNKFSYKKSDFDRDAKVPVYRAAGIHLYAAEVYALWMQNKGGLLRPEVNFSLEILNNGVYDKNPAQLGVRGRVGFGDGDDAIKIGNYIYIHHPYTNQITGWYNYTGNLLAMQIYLLKVIMDERARELAYEGERFYDLMRVAERTNNPAYLADKVAAKFEGAEAERIRSLLLDKKNWYVNFFGE